MANGQPARQYMVFDAEQLMQQQPHQPLDPVSIDDAVWQVLLQTNTTGFTQNDYTIDSVPFVTYHPGNISSVIPDQTPQQVFSVSFPDDDAADRFRSAAFKAIHSPNNPLKAIGVSPNMGVANYSVPVAPDAALFGTIDDAIRLINADQLPGGLSGEGVNVVVIDTGIDQSIVPPGQFGGGWHPKAADPTLPPPPLPGQTSGSDAVHGMMIVNNILALAPKATIFDVPLLPPPRITNIFSFLHAAEAVFHKLLHDIQWFRANGPFRGPWILMNAWAIYDRRSEGAHLGEYTENRGPGGIPPHPFIHRIEQVGQAKIDMVFSAGNCGEVCPDDRCGPNDFGPARGIWGANAHRDVITAGAVRVDTIWPGYSSEGPGPTPNLYEQKPDLCTPSQFIGIGGYPPNTGTSASAAVAAGVVAALRTKANWDQTTVPPFVLKLILNSMTMQPLGPGWNCWLGNGVLDAHAAYKQLLASY